MVPGWCLSVACLVSLYTISLLCISLYIIRDICLDIPLDICLDITLDISLDITQNLSLDSSWIPQILLSRLYLDYDQ